MRTFVPSAKRSRSSAARVCTSFAAVGRFARSPGAGGDARRFTNASVSRTDRPREMTSRDAWRCAAGSVNASSARAWPIVSRARREFRRALHRPASAVGRSWQPSCDPFRPRRRSGRASVRIRRRAADTQRLRQSGFRFSRWMFSINASCSSWRSSSIGTSRTTTGTFSRPARCAARHRRSPAMMR